MGYLTALCTIGSGDWNNGSMTTIQYDRSHSKSGNDPGSSQFYTGCGGWQMSGASVCVERGLKHWSLT